MPNIRFAFVGFRHPHIFDMHTRCAQRQDIDIVASCEEDTATRASLADAGKVDITHESYAAMLKDVEADVVAVGDYYGKRGALILAALEAGRHVIADKPLCTSLDELDAIEAAARKNQRTIGCMLDMRDSPILLGMRDLVQRGEIGPVRAIGFGGQHPLKFGTRPGWYFEPGKHGGTINDIAVHALDAIPWITGSNWKTLHAARCWHHLPPEAPHFEGCGQLMMSLANGAGVVGDVSYLSPDSFNYTLSQYWRFKIWGDGGFIEAGYNDKAIALYQDGRTEVQHITPPAGKPGAYLDSFLAEIGGATGGLHLSSTDVLRAARISLIAQHAADNGLANVDLSGL